VLGHDKGVRKGDGASVRKGVGSQSWDIATLNVRAMVAQVLAAMPESSIVRLLLLMCSLFIGAGGDA
jgi:hypothetical protein